MATVIFGNHSSEIAKKDPRTVLFMIRAPIKV